MTLAGFYTIESHEIRFGRDGVWYSNGEPIANAKIALLFSRSIRRGDDGRWLLQMGDEKAAIDVEDTPWVVRGLGGSETEGFRLVLNDETTEALDPSSLRRGPDHALYSPVKNGTAEARWLRPAYYALAAQVESDPAGGFAVRIGGHRYPIVDMDPSA